MAIAYPDFVGAFPEFSNATKYPAAGINFWITQAYAQLNAQRFGAALDLAAMLFVAHNTVLGARDAATAAASGVTGQATGPLASKSVGGASASYDVGAVSTAGAGIYNSTSYGQRLYYMIQQYCSGPVYVSGQRRGGAFGGFGFLR